MSEFSDSGTGALLFEKSAVQYDSVLGRAAVKFRSRLPDGRIVKTASQVRTAASRGSDSGAYSGYAPADPSSDGVACAVFRGVSGLAPAGILASFTMSGMEGYNGSYRRDGAGFSNGSKYVRRVQWNGGHVWVVSESDSPVFDEAPLKGVDAQGDPFPSSEDAPPPEFRTADGRTVRLLWNVMDGWSDSGGLTTRLSVQVLPALNVTGSSGTGAVRIWKVVAADAGSISSAASMNPDGDPDFLVDIPSSIGGGVPYAGGVSYPAIQLSAGDVLYARIPADLDTGEWRCSVGTDGGSDAFGIAVSGGFPESPSGFEPADGAVSNVLTADGPREFRVFGFKAAEAMEVRVRALLAPDWRCSGTVPLDGSGNAVSGDVGIEFSYASQSLNRTDAASGQYDRITQASVASDDTVSDSSGSASPVAVTAQRVSGVAGYTPSGSVSAVFGGHFLENYVLEETRDAAEPSKFRFNLFEGVRHADDHLSAGFLSSLSTAAGTLYSGPYADVTHYLRRDAANDRWEVVRYPSLEAGVEVDDSLEVSGIVWPVPLDPSDPIGSLFGSSRRLLPWDMEWTKEGVDGGSVVFSSSDSGSTMLAEPTDAYKAWRGGRPADSSEPAESGRWIDTPEYYDWGAEVSVSRNGTALNVSFAHPVTEFASGMFDSDFFEGHIWTNGVSIDLLASDEHTSQPNIYVHWDATGGQNSGQSGYRAVNTGVYKYDEAGGVWRNGDFQIRKNSTSHRMELVRGGDVLSFCYTEPKFLGEKIGDSQSGPSDSQSGSGWTEYSPESLYFCDGVKKSGNMVCLRGDSVGETVATSASSDVLGDWTGCHVESDSGSGGSYLVRGSSLLTYSTCVSLLGDWTGDVKVVQESGSLRVESVSFPNVSGEYSRYGQVNGRDAYLMRGFAGTYQVMHDGSRWVLCSGFDGTYVRRPGEDYWECRLDGDGSPAATLSFSNGYFRATFTESKFHEDDRKTGALYYESGIWKIRIVQPSEFWFLVPDGKFDPEKRYGSIPQSWWVLLEQLKTDENNDDYWDEAYDGRMSGLWNSFYHGVQGSVTEWIDYLIDVSYQYSRYGSHKTLGYKSLANNYTGWMVSSSGGTGWAEISSAGEASYSVLSSENVLVCEKMLPVMFNCIDEFVGKAGPYEFQMSGGEVSLVSENDSGYGAAGVYVSDVASDSGTSGSDSGGAVSVMLRDYLKETVDGVGDFILYFDMQMMEWRMKISKKGAGAYSYAGSAGSPICLMEWGKDGGGFVFQYDMDGGQWSLSKETGGGTAVGIYGSTGILPGHRRTPANALWPDGVVCGCPDYLSFSSMPDGSDSGAAAAISLISPAEMLRLPGASDSGSSIGLYYYIGQKGAWCRDPGYSDPDIWRGDWLALKSGVWTAEHYDDSMFGTYSRYGTGPVSMGSRWMNGRFMVASGNGRWELLESSGGSGEYAPTGHVAKYDVWSSLGRDVLGAAMSASEAGGGAVEIGMRGDAPDERYAPMYGRYVQVTDGTVFTMEASILSGSDSGSFACAFSLPEAFGHDGIDYVQVGRTETSGTAGYAPDIYRFHLDADAMRWAVSRYACDMNGQYSRYMRGDTVSENGWSVASRRKWDDGVARWYSLSNAGEWRIVLSGESGAVASQKEVDMLPFGQWEAAGSGSLGTVAGDPRMFDTGSDSAAAALVEGVMVDYPVPQRGSSYPVVRLGAASGGAYVCTHTVFPCNVNGSGEGVWDDGYLGNAESMSIHWRADGVLLRKGMLLATAVSDYRPSSITVSEAATASGLPMEMSFAGGAGLFRITASGAGLVLPEGAASIEFAISDAGAGVDPSLRAIVHSGPSQAFGWEALSGLMDFAGEWFSGSVRVRSWAEGAAGRTLPFDGEVAMAYFPDGALRIQLDASSLSSGSRRYVKSSDEPLVVPFHLYAELAGGEGTERIRVGDSYVFDRLEAATSLVSVGQYGESSDSGFGGYPWVWESSGSGSRKLGPDGDAEASILGDGETITVWDSGEATHKVRLPYGDTGLEPEKIVVPESWRVSCRDASSGQSVGEYSIGGAYYLADPSRSGYDRVYAGSFQGASGKVPLYVRNVPTGGQPRWAVSFEPSGGSYVYAANNYGDGYADRPGDATASLSYSYDYYSYRGYQYRGMYPEGFGPLLVYERASEHGISRQFHFRLVDRYGNTTSAASFVGQVHSRRPESPSLSLKGSSGSPNYTGFFVRDGRFMPSEYIQATVYAQSSLRVRYRITGSQMMAPGGTGWRDLPAAGWTGLVRIRAGEVSSDFLEETSCRMNFGAEFEDEAGNESSDSGTIMFIGGLFRTGSENLVSETPSYSHRLYTVSGGSDLLLARMTRSDTESYRSWNEIWWPATHGSPLLQDGSIDPEEALSVSNAIGASSRTAAGEAYAQQYDPLQTGADGRLKTDADGRYVQDMSGWDSSKTYGDMVNSDKSNGYQTYWIIDNSGNSEFTLEFEVFDFDTGITPLPRNNAFSDDGDGLVVWDASGEGTVVETKGERGTELRLMDGARMTKLFTLKGSYRTDSQERFMLKPAAGVDMPTAITEGAYGFTIPGIPATSRICITPFTDSQGAASGFKLKAGPRHAVEYYNYEMIDSVGEVWAHVSPAASGGGWTGTAQLRANYQYYRNYAASDYDGGAVLLGGHTDYPVLGTFAAYTYLDDISAGLAARAPSSYFENRPLLSFATYADDIPAYTEPSFYAVRTGVVPVKDQMYDFSQTESHPSGKMSSYYNFVKDTGILTFTGAGYVPKGRIYGDYYYHTFYRITSDGYGDLYFYGSGILVPAASGASGYSDYAYVDVKVVNEGDNTLLGGQLQFLTRGYVTKNDIVDTVLDQNRPWDVQEGSTAETVLRIGAERKSSYTALTAAGYAAAANAVGAGQVISLGDIPPKGEVYLRVYWTIFTSFENDKGTAWIDITTGPKTCSAEFAGTYTTFSISTVT